VLESSDATTELSGDYKAKSDPWNSSKPYSDINIYISSSKQVPHNQEMLPQNIRISQHQQLAGYWPFDAIISYFTPIKEAVFHPN